MSLAAEVNSQSSSSSQPVTSHGAPIGSPVSLVVNVGGPPGQRDRRRYREGQRGGPDTRLQPGCVEVVDLPAERRAGGRAHPPSARPRYRRRAVPGSRRRSSHHRKPKRAIRDADTAQIYLRRSAWIGPGDTLPRWTRRRGRRSDEEDLATFVLALREDLLANQAACGEPDSGTVPRSVSRVVQRRTRLPTSSTAVSSSPSNQIGTWSLDADRHPPVYEYARSDLPDRSALARNATAAELARVNRDDLRMAADREGVRESAYTPDGGLPPERFVLRSLTVAGAFYYSDAAERVGEMFFDTEDEACSFMLLKVVGDPTTRHD